MYLKNTTSKPNIEPVAVCCSVLQCVAVCCSALRCSMLQRVAYTSRTQRANKTPLTCCSMLQYVAVCCSMLQYVAVCCSMSQYVAVCCSMWRMLRCSKLQRVAYTLRTQRANKTPLICCSMLQYVAVCCSMLQYVVVPCSVL